MLFLKQLLASFFNRQHIESVMENDERFHIEISSPEFLSPIVEEVDKPFGFLNDRDKIKLIFIFGSSEPVIFNSDDDIFDDFIKKLSDEYSYQEGENVSLTLDIFKTKAENKISIYSWSTFFSHLNELTIAQSFSVISRAIGNSQNLIFEVSDLAEEFYTETLSFIPHGQQNNQSKDLPDRANLIEKQKSCVLFGNKNSLTLIPDDFKLTSISNPDLSIQKLFGRYTAILSCIYLMDISTLNGNILSFTVNGYKSIKGTADFSNPHTSAEQYFNIYKWTYTGGNLNDKIGLSRNLITLHFDSSGNLVLKGRPYESILSSYRVYEKQNIKQYIEIRSKISDQLLDFNNRANKIIETFASGFQKSALALVSFYLSAIVVKVLAKIDQYSQFSTEATILSVVFVAFSFIYYRGARWEVREQRKRFVSSYENLKLRYTDLLNEEDIKRIVNDDKEYNEDLGFIDNKLKVYSRIWIMFLGILLLVTFYLYFIHSLHILNKTWLFQFLLNNQCAD